MSKKIKLLVVEDNEDERMFIKEGLTATGLFEVLAEAGNGDELLELLKQPSLVPEMVLSDLRMPGKNGYDVLTEVKHNESFAHIPIVILSTAPDIPFAERCKKLGACAYFTKPDTFLEYEDFGQMMYDAVIHKCFKRPQA